MIDFEKSRSLHANPFMGAGSVDPRRLLPTAELGQLLRVARPISCPPDILNQIRGISRQQLDELLREVAEDMPLAAWYESSAELLHRRGQELDRFVEAVWRAPRRSPKVDHLCSVRLAHPAPRTLACKP